MYTTSQSKSFEIMETVELKQNGCSALVPNVESRVLHKGMSAEDRYRYLQFASDASHFFKGEKPVRFTGEHWCL